MRQVPVQVVLTRHRETVMAHLGHLPTSEVHCIEVEALPGRSLFVGNHNPGDP
jgi:hypothetical protein